MIQSARDCDCPPGADCAAVPRNAAPIKLRRKRLDVGRNEPAQDFGVYPRADFLDGTAPDNRLLAFAAVASVAARLELYQPACL